MFHSISYKISVVTACLLCVLSSWTMAHSTPQQTVNSSAGEWWREPFGQLQTNLREIDADMDVNEVIDFIEQHGATAWLIGVGGILANYPTELDFQLSNPYLARRKSGDLIQDALDAARARGMRLLARMDFSKVQAEVANEHPDWLYRNPEGGTQNHTNGLVSVCPSGEYYQERIFDILEEVMRRYEMDGFFVNWSSFNEVDYFKVYHGVCHCDNCQRRWKEWAGDLEFPRGREDPTYPQWQNFSSEIIDDWTARVQALISEKLPDAGLMLGTSAKILFHEANNAVDREMWHFATSEAVSKEISYRPDVPVLVNSVAFVDMPYRMGSEEPSMYAQYILQTISRGGNPSTYIMGIPGKIPYTNLNIAGQITSFHRDHKDVYNGMRPVAKTGLVAPDDALLNSTQYEEAESEFQGLYTSLQELHIPFDVLEMARLAATAEYRGLDGYNVLILPNIGALQSADAEALDSWVAAGGRVIATGSIGLDGEDNVQLASLPAQRQTEVVNEREKLWSTYFAPPQNRTQDNYYTGPIVPIYGAHHKYEWKGETTGIYKILDFAPFAPPEYAYGNIQGDEDGASIASYESGKGIIIPFAIGRGYRELGLSVFRDFFALVLEEEGAPGETLSFDFAEQVDVTLNQNGNMTIVHLINASGARKQNFGKWLPVPEGLIQIQSSGSGADSITARALLSGAELDVRNGTIVVPGLDLWEVIVIEGLE